jgi:glucose/arabinose dehydrogenase
VRRLVIAGVSVAALATGVAVALAAREGSERSSALRLIRIARVDQPVHVSAPRSEPNNVYIVERTGRVRVRLNGRLRARPFLDLSRSVSTGSEQGLLSIAFHPRYARNRLFYVYYTDRGEDTRIVEYRSRGLARRPVRTRQLFFQADPYSNHNGGQLAFGLDGNLYAGTGDGGSGGDPENRAQNLQSLFGKLLRFNVNRRQPQPIIVGYGLRNPWRFSFDRRTGDLYIGDVGQNSWEELNYTPRRSPGLENYGWRVYEGKARYTQETPNAAGRLVMPYVALPNPPNCSVIGGFVYRGSAVPSARGRYFFSDNCAGRVRSVAARGGTSVRDEPFRVDGSASFGEDAQGELYIVSVQSGNVYKLAE